MNKQNVAKFFKGMQTSISKHSPDILIGIGIAGIFSTAILAVRATPKALKLIEAEKRRQNNKLIEDAKKEGRENCEQVTKLTPIDTVKVSWKCYIPAAISGVTSTACFIGARSIHASRNAALAAAYKISETALQEYQEKVIETIGEKKELAIQEKLDKDRLEKQPVSTSEVIMTKRGTTLCMDYLSGRYFESDIDHIKKAENELNKRMLHDLFGSISLNEFYDELGLDRVGMGDIIGWNVHNLIDIRIGSGIADDGRPCIVVAHHNAPSYDFDKIS